MHVPGGKEALGQTLVSTVCVTAAMVSTNMVESVLDSQTLTPWGCWELDRFPGQVHLTLKMESVPIILISKKVSDCKYRVKKCLGGGRGGEWERKKSVRGNLDFLRTPSPLQNSFSFWMVGYFCGLHVFIPERSGSLEGKLKFVFVKVLHTLTEATLEICSLEVPVVLYFVRLVCC